MRTVVRTMLAAATGAVLVAGGVTAIRLGEEPDDAAVPEVAAAAGGEVLQGDDARPVPEIVLPPEEPPAAVPPAALPPVAAVPAPVSPAAAEPDAVQDAAPARERPV
ncbi:MAG: hypothetical protein NTW05_11800, partial [Pseudonocardiales bacterium]|nr:hypothetical protein [Pseudonocardiales bacterium]